MSKDKEILEVSVVVESFKVVNTWWRIWRRPCGNFFIYRNEKITHCSTFKGYETLEKAIVAMARCYTIYGLRTHSLRLSTIKKLY